MQSLSNMTSLQIKSYFDTLLKSLWGKRKALEDLERTFGEDDETRSKHAELNALKRSILDAALGCHLAGIDKIHPMLIYREQPEPHFTFGDLDGYYNMSETPAPDDF